MRNNKGQFVKGDNEMRGSKHWKWKGGKSITGKGYILISTGSDQILEHRLVWEGCNRACLLPWGIVHHKNHIKTDNRFSNLEAMSNNNHSELTQKEQPYIINQWGIWGHSR